MIFLQVDTTGERTLWLLTKTLVMSNGERKDSTGRPKRSIDASWVVGGGFGGGGGGNRATVFLIEVEVC